MFYNTFYKKLNIILLININYKLSKMTEAFTGVTLDKAKEMATEALDQAVVLDVIKNKLVGRYYVVTGPRLDRFILVDTIKQDETPIEDDIKRILAATAAPVAQEA